MAGEKRTWVRQAFMKRSFMRRRTTAIHDCWQGPLAGACSGFWEGAQNPPLPNVKRLGPKQDGPHRSQTLTTKLANKNLIEQLGITLALGSLHQRAHEAAKHLLALLRVFLVLVLSHLIRHAGQHLINHGF